LRLERLCADRRKEYGVQAESCLGGARHAEMAEVGRVERAAKESYAAAAREDAELVAAGLLAHVFMLVRMGVW
jgi:hypothetical protein